MFEEKTEGFRLSPQQRRLWMLARDGRATSYHVSGVILIEGRLDQAMLRQAVEQVVRRHDILRTGCVRLPGMSIPVQVVTDGRPRWRTLQGESTIDSLVKGNGEAFDLERGDVVHATLASLGPERHLLGVRLPALCADGPTLRLLVREIVKAYEEVLGSAAPDDEPIQYADLAEWQNDLLEGEETREQRSYWSRFDLSRPMPVLPFERSVSADVGHAPAAVTHELPGEVVQAVVRAAQQAKVSPSAVLLAAWHVLLSRLTGESAPIVGVGCHGRTYEETAEALGPLAKYLPVAVACDPRRSFLELLADSHRMLAEVPDWQEYFNWEDSAAGGTEPPYFAFGFDWDEEPPGFSTAGVKFSLASQAVWSERFNVRLSCRLGGATVRGELQYDSNRFDEQAIRMLGRQYERLLSAFTCSPDAPVGRPPLLGEAEHRALVVDANATAVDYPRDRCYQDLLADRAALTPDQPAVCGFAGDLTYGELDRRASRLAAHLGDLGVGPDRPVGLFVERSPELLVGMLGIMRAGGAYVPLDPSYPADRLKYMIEDSGAEVIVTVDALAQGLDAGRAQLFRLDSAGDPPAPGSRSGPHPENLAYIIYTSGSTGRPKGTMISHRSLLNYLSWAARAYRLDASSRVPVHSPVGFDLTVTSLLLPLLVGARCELLDDALGLQGLQQALWSGDDLGLVKLTPAHLRALDPSMPDGPAATRIGALILGGEALRAEALEWWRRNAPGTRLINEYGPTEATVGCCVYEVDSSDPATGSIAIGNPIANTRLYVLDPELNPVPRGVTGELYIGGDSLARGYLNRPDLTADRFVPDPLADGEGERLYRTGDRCRFLPDGRLDFLGRVDHQVKIRGYRIEPGEIESVLEESREIQEAAVLARDDSASGARLVAYVVPASGRRPTTSSLRKALLGTLPEHMVPSAFVVLKKLPLTANGKLDRNSLPAPEESGRPELEQAYVAASNDVERTLVGIWSEVLGLDRIGVRDNFFELGGDSILSIQVVSRAKRVGLIVTPQQLFQHQTIAELASATGSTRLVEAEQGAVTGDVPLTPIQRWWLGQEPTEVHHNNQAVLLEVPSDLDDAAIERVMSALLEHHDALRARLVRGDDGSWSQCIVAPEPAAASEICSRVDLSSLSGNDRVAELERRASALQASLDPASGPMLRVARYVTGDARDRLLLVVHHWVIDGVSWRILLEDLVSAYGQVASGAETIALGPKTTSYKVWAERLRAQALEPSSGQLDAEIDYWKTIATEDGRIPLDRSDGDNTFGSAASVEVELDAQQTQALLQTVPAAYRTRVDEVLLTALARALTQWTGRDTVLVELEGHGREELFADVDLSRTVGWFTTVYPVRLKADWRRPGESLKTVKEQLRATPARGIGYGLLRWLRGDPRLGAVLETSADVSFNYLGRLDGNLPEGGHFRPATESPGAMHAGGNRRPYRLTVNGAIADGRLRLQWTYSRELHDGPTIERVARKYISALSELIEHCRSAEAGGCTPSDFPLAGLDQPVLDRVVGGDRDVEDIYPLSPLQAGMLFHALYAPEDGLYFEQVSCTLRGELDAAAFRGAWQHATDRHPVLRTGFLWEDLVQPLQVVRRSVEVPWELLDWRDVPAAERGARVERLQESDRVRGFELGRPPMMRLTLVRLEDEAWRLIWSHHHLILDGWSLAAVLRDVLLYYEGARGGDVPSLPRSRPFRDYVAWLDGQDLAEAEAFWRRQLRGLTGPTSLGIERAVVAEGGGHRELKTVLSEATTRALDAVARKHHLTLNTLVQGAWALLLGRYAGQRDVLFGATVSGRTASLDGIDSMLGLFINTMPVRVRFEDDLSAVDWLGLLQKEQATLRHHEWSSLVQIQEWAGIPRDVPLFESILVFENYPIDRALRQPRESLTAEDVVYWERTNYALTVLVIPEQELALRVAFDSSRYDEPSIDRLLGHFRSLLEALAEDPERHLGELPMLSGPERDQVVRAWNATATPYRDDICVHTLVDEQIRRSPQAIAVEGPHASLDYQALGERADALADRLRSMGVGPDSLVGICMDRSPELIVALFGTLKAGAAYTPLDPSYPAQRLRFMVEDARAPVILTRGDLANGLEGAGVRILPLDGNIGGPDAIGGMHRAGCSAPSAATPDDLAYVIYTSGSTGRPKGVAMSHRSMVNLIGWQLERFETSGPARTLQFTSPSFDVSFQEIFATLASGGTLILIEDDERLDAERLLTRLEQASVERLFLPFVALHNLAEVAARENSSIGSLKEVITAGEQVQSTPAVRALFDGRRLDNQYGPTESHVVTGYRLGDDAAGWPQLPPIGRPVANSQMYVLDPSLEPTPVGVAGELYIGGLGVARGYLHRPGLTAERFVPDPFSARPGARVYRTGDLCRWLPDGNIEFLGRCDHQVKIRGFRVELGEIESMLAAEPGVREVAVVAREDRPGLRRLAAYVVPPQGAVVDEAALRRVLSERLPDYMVPSAWVILDALPLTPSGKVARKELPAPDGTRVAAGTPYVAPRSAVEQQLAGIWSELLGVQQIGVHDSFFELGGHSLIATQLVSRIRRAFEIDLPLRSLFESATVAGLAEVVRRTRTGMTAPSMRPVSRGESLELSFAQERLWFFDRLVPGSSAYNMPAAVRIRGDLDVPSLTLAFREIVRRHEVLHTRFVTENGKPRQIVELFDLELPEHDLRDVPAADRERELRRRVDDEAKKTFDIETGPLLRVSLVRFGPTEQVLLLTLHHIVSDGWSMVILVREFGALYEAFAAGRPSPLGELEIQYADFAAWQRDWLRGEVLDTQLEYWRRQLADVPVLDMPTDRPRPERQMFRAGVCEFELSPVLSEDIRSLGRSHGATLFMTLLAAYQIVLARYSGQQDIVVGTNIANRNRAEIEELIGFFINNLALRTDLSGDPTFLELLERVRRVSLDAFDHQDLPFEKLVAELHPDRDPGREPLFQAVFVLQNLPLGDTRLPGGLEVGLMPVSPVTSKNDLVLSAWERGTRLAGTLEYNADLFDAETIRRMLGHLETLLGSAVSSPTRPISELRLLESAELDQVVVGWNDTVAKIAGDDCLHQRFEAQVDRSPDAVAVVFEDEKLTYRQLSARANRLAHELREQGVGPDVRVGVLLERSSDLIVALLGVLKAGGAYVPLDPDYPADRLGFMLEDAHAPLVLTQQRTRPIAETTDARVICFDRDAARLAAHASDAPQVSVAPDNLAYVIYTSGSTGRPKGVTISHRAIVNHMAWMQSEFPLDESDRVLQKTPMSFDASVWEFWAPILAGGVLVFARQGRHGDPAYLVRTVREQGITTLQLVPTLLGLLLDADGIDRCDSLRRVFCGGEALSSDLRDRFFERAHADLCNLYGPTEATIDTIYCKLDRSDRRRVVPVGRPVFNTRAYVVDARLEPVPVGVPGELVLAGAALARGYLNRPAATAERFVPDPFSTVPGGRLYRTGDRCRRLADGAIEFLGRIDAQVKLRGFRIEPGEIEVVLAEHPDVVHAAVTIREDTPGDRRLIGYAVKRAGATANATELREFAASRVPDYMVPSSVVLLESMPLTPGGKVDRKALPAPTGTRDDAVQDLPAPRTPVEGHLVAMWAELLGVDRVGVQEDFFALGGHSLLATQMISRVSDTFDVELPLWTIFESPTVEGIARSIEELGGVAGEGRAALIPRVARGENLPLSFAQQRLWFLDQLVPGTSAYNVPAALRLVGPLDTAIVERVIGEIVARHEILRTTFETVDGRPVQRIAPARRRALPVIDLGQSDAATRRSNAERLANEEARRPFDLTQGPLFRVTLVRLSDDEHVMLASMHHIIADGWSFGVLAREFLALYEAFANGKPSPLPELPIQYADFASWQAGVLEGDGAEPQLSFWRDRLRDVPLTQIPTDRSRAAVQGFNGRTTTFDLPGDLVTEMKRLVDRQGATPFMGYLAAFDVLLSRYTGQVDVVVGTPIAGRNRTEIEGLIGFFVNSLVLRTDLSGNPTFREIVGRVREVASGAYANQDVPFEKLVEEARPDRDMTREPLFQIMFGMRNVPVPRLDLPRGLSIEPLAVDIGQSKFDLTFMVGESDCGLRVSVEYNTDLYEAATIERLVEHYGTLLAGAVRAPDRSMSELPLMLEAERSMVLVEWNDTKADYPSGCCANTLVEQIAVRTPAAEAVIVRGKSWSYGDLERQANRLAHHLRALGVGRETLVGVCMHRSPDMLVAILGILKAGGAFLPLDPSYPVERLEFMIEDSGVALILSQQELIERLPAGATPVLRLDEIEQTLDAQPDSPPDSDTTSDNLAYAIYTSGSTGRPKGTLLTHEGLCNLTRFQQRTFDLGQGKRVLQFASLSYDAAVWEIFMTLANGATLVLAEADRMMPGPGLAELLREERVDVLTAPPSILAMLSPDMDGLPETIIVAGEKCPSDLVAAWAAGRRLFNAYGPTEDTVCSTIERCRVNDDAGDPPIGRPVFNHRAYILDDDLNPVPVGAAGELYLAGVGLARGYLRRPELTAERFVADPFATIAGGRLYRTGDVARWRDDGRIQYLGRIDHQVKVRGFRIELGEIEAVLSESDGVRQCVVMAREDVPGDRRLVAYVQADAGASPDPSRMREQVSSRLAEFMVPSAFVLLDEFPRSTSDKIDLKALPAPDRCRDRTGREYVAPRTPTQQRLAGIWAEVLDVDRVGVDDNFFELGGHSLLATRLMSRLREAFEVDLPLRELFEVRTVAGLAEVIDKASREPQAPKIERIERESVEAAGAEDLLARLDEMSPQEVQALLGELEDEDRTE